MAPSVSECERLPKDCRQHMCHLLIKGYKRGARLSVSYRIIRHVKTRRSEPAIFYTSDIVHCTMPVDLNSGLKTKTTKTAASSNTYFVSATFVDLP